MGCLCQVSCAAVGWDCSAVSCGYNPEAVNSSPACADASGGQCVCQGYGCGRAPLVSDGKQAQSCFDSYAKPTAGDGKCETGKGENCSSTAEDCACQNSSICDPVNEAAQEDGCFTPPDNICPQGASLSPTTGRCFCDRAEYLFTDQGCVANCPAGANYSQTQQKCLCQRIGYIIEGDKCVQGNACPKNSSLKENKCICDNGFKPNREQTDCVQNLGDAARFNKIIDLYKIKIPKGIVNNGTLNNARSFFDSKYSEFACGGYQSKILSFLDGLRFSNDPEERALVENFDYGPIQAYFGGHQAVAIYPKGTNWIDDGIVLDPWPSQAPEYVTMAEWAVRFSAGSYQGIKGSGPYEANPSYPTVGGTYQNLNSKKLTPEESKKLFASLPPDKQIILKNLPQEQREEWLRRQSNEPKVKVYLHSPVSAYLETADGKKMGDTASGNVFEDEITGVAIAKIKLRDGYYANYFYIPEGEFTIKFTGTVKGEVTLLAGMMQDNGEYTVQSVKFVIEKNEDFELPISAVEGTIYIQPVNGEPDIIETANTIDDVGSIPKADVFPKDNDAESFATTTWGDLLDKNCPDNSEIKDGKCTCQAGYSTDENGSCVQGDDILSKYGVYIGIGCILCCTTLLAGGGVIIFVVKRKKQNKPT